MEGEEEEEEKEGEEEGEGGKRRQYLRCEMNAPLTSHGLAASVIFINQCFFLSLSLFLSLFIRSLSLLLLLLLLILLLLGLVLGADAVSPPLIPCVGIIAINIIYCDSVFVSMLVLVIARY